MQVLKPYIEAYRIVADVFARFARYRETLDEKSHAHRQL